jgi:hypothetical protein
VPSGVVAVLSSLGAFGGRTTKATTALAIMVLAMV